RHLAAASGHAARVRLADLPIAAGAAEVATLLGREPAQFAAESGEEYELLCTLPPSELAKAIAAVEQNAATTLTVIGEVTRERSIKNDGSGGEVEFLDGDGRAVVVAGYDHFD
ncbi:MAG: hypothetical protein WAO61_05110, partial [Solirubrobacterales bacterium]